MLALASLALVGCLEEQQYLLVGETVQLRADDEPVFVGENDESLYRAERPFSLPITPPSEAALATLSSGATGLPFPRRPWVALHDLDLTLDYALTSQSREPVLATVTVDGVNEFSYYAPGPLSAHQWQRRIALAPGARVEGSVSELELSEVAVDLATVVNGAPNSELVVSAESQSSRDPRVRPYVPRVVPGLVGLRVGVQSTSARDLTLTISVRVQDHGDRAAKRGERAWQLPEAQAFTPIIPDLD